MTDSNLMGMDQSLFQLRAASTDKTLDSVRSGRLQKNAVKNDELEKASRQFESLLLNFMIREMRATVPQSGLFPRSMAEEIYTSMLDEQLSGVMAENGGIGISRMLIDQLNETKTDQ